MKEKRGDTTDEMVNKLRSRASSIAALSTFTSDILYVSFKFEFSEGTNEIARGRSTRYLRTQRRVASASVVKRVQSARMRMVCLSAKLNHG